MTVHKRKRTFSKTESKAEALDYTEKAASDDEFDLTAILTGKKSRVYASDSGNDDDELKQFIQNEMSSRAVKEGVQVVKLAKGKSKLIKGELGGGSFQSMGLQSSLLRSLTLQGYRIPTPIQRLSIPALLASPPKDLVGMARTGSGKSLAFLVPLVQRLSGRHSQNFGARALILLPTRELALQVLKVGKELARGFGTAQGDHAGDKVESDSKKGPGLRWSLIVGGEGLDEQFEMITNNPDVIIATPGRLLHLIVEMNLDLKAVQFVVFDEADRLFEMGFETALTEILHRLPTTRQTVLFSATLPKSLVEFAKAGLQDPKLVRLDAESKISSDLKMAFFSVKQSEKDACLLSLLRDLIKVPLKDEMDNESNIAGIKPKGKSKPVQFTEPHQTLVFAATKHHVEYLKNLLATAGYAVSYIYGSLDQTARSMQMDQFRRGITSILVVTDVAARGIDIPVLENVINFDFPQGARVFVHRVGRTARAGRQGWAWSFITNTELPHLLDLQLFLERPLRADVSSSGDQVYTESLVLGTFPRDKIDQEVEYVRSLDDVNHTLPVLREVMIRGHAMYERSKGKASHLSYKRAKAMTKDPNWQLAGSDSGIHPVLLRSDGAVKLRENEEAKKQLLQKLNIFRPLETVFEITGKGKFDNAALMKERRKALSKSAQRALASTSAAAAADGESENEVIRNDSVEMADEGQITAVFHNKKETFRDEEFYLSYRQKGAMTEKGYSLTDGASSFVKQAQGVTFDLTGDEGKALRKNKQLTWDKKKKKFIQGDGAGADNMKLVKTEGGVKLPASYRSGRFDEWKAKNRVSLPRTGEAENAQISGHKPVGAGGHRFKHNKLEASKPLDKLHLNYDRKFRKLKKRDEEKTGEASSVMPGKKGSRSAPGGRYGGKSFGRVKSELKTTDQIRKTRQVAEKKRAKNARPGRGSKKGKR